LAKPNAGRGQLPTLTLLIPFDQFLACQLDQYAEEQLPVQEKRLFQFGQGERRIEDQSLEDQGGEPIQAGWLAGLYQGFHMMKEQVCDPEGPWLKRG
jgi:hypothetical protein